MHTAPRDWLARLDSPGGHVLALALVTGVAFALRWFKLGEWSFWIDELFFIRRAESQSTLQEVLARWPPLSVILTGGVLRAFGVSEWSARLVPALIGVLSIPALYVPLRRMLGPRVALLAVLLLAVSPWHVFWSQNARYYTALLLLATLASLAFYFALERDSVPLLVLFYVLLVLAFRERALALLVAAAALCYVAVLKLVRFDPPPGLRLRMVALLLVLAGGLLLYDGYQYLASGYSQLLAAFEQPYSQPVEDPFRLATFIGFDIGLPLAALALFGGLFGVVRRDRAGLFLLLNALVPVVLLLAINPWHFTKDRYAFLTLTSWIALAAMAIGHLLRTASGAQRLLALGVVAALLADAGGDHLLYFHANNGGRLDWRGAFAIARAQGQGSDTVVSWWTEFGPYYLGREVTRWADVKPAAVEASGRRHWFVLDSETVWTNGAAKDWVERHAELVDVHYLRTPDEASVRVYLYDPNHRPARGSAPASP